MDMQNRFRTFFIFMNNEIQKVPLIAQALGLIIILITATVITISTFNYVAATAVCVSGFLASYVIYHRFDSKVRFFYLFGALVVAVVFILHLLFLSFH